MPIFNLTGNDVQFLNALADALMWAGKDRAADAIYASLEADEPATPEGGQASKVSRGLQATTGRPTHSFSVRSNDGKCRPLHLPRDFRRNVCR